MKKPEGAILAAAGAAMNETAQLIVRKTGAPAIADSRCIACGKPTRSHKLCSLVMCHTCYTRLTPSQLDILDNIIELSRLEKLEGVAIRSCRQKLLIALNQWKNSGVRYCIDHDHVGARCPNCDAADAQGEAEAEQQAAAAQAEYEAAAREQAEYEAQQASDEAYYHNQGGPDGY